jgi:hypothetical protein
VVVVNKVATAPPEQFITPSLQIVRFRLALEHLAPVGPVPDIFFQGAL